MTQIDIAVSVIGAAIAVLVHGAAELRDHRRRRCPATLAEAAAQRREPLAERAQPVGELPVVVALTDMGIPAARLGKDEADPRVGGHQPGEPGRLRRKAVGRRRTVIGHRLVGSACRRSARRGPSRPSRYCRLERIVAGVEAVEGSAPPPACRSPWRCRGLASERHIGRPPSCP